MSICILQQKENQRDSCWHNHLTKKIEIEFELKEDLFAFNWNVLLSLPKFCFKLAIGLHHYVILSLQSFHNLII